jgi:hypothetical protein
VSVISRMIFKAPLRPVEIQAEKFCSRASDRWDEAMHDLAIVTNHFVGAVAWRAVCIRTFAALAVAEAKSASQVMQGVAAVAVAGAPAK